MPRKNERPKFAPSARGKKSSQSCFTSMTGFGKGSALLDGVQVDVEIRSVNHRFLEIACKLPKTYAEFEMSLRNAVSTALSRGRVEVYVSRLSKKGNGAGVVFNKELYKTLFALFHSVVAKHGAVDAAGKRALSLNLLGRNEVLAFGEEKIDYAREQRLLLEAVNLALSALSAMRRTEGLRLEHEVLGRFKTVSKLHQEIRKIAHSAPQRQRERLNLRLKRLAPETMVDPARLAQEVVMISDRVDVTEEIVRLESHLAEFSRAMRAHPQGKKMDFLLQEMGREFNTIASKAQEAPIQQRVVDAKVELEKLKEQLQNVE